MYAPCSGNIASEVVNVLWIFPPRQAGVLETELIDKPAGSVPLGGKLVHDTPDVVRA